MGPLGLGGDVAEEAKEASRKKKGSHRRELKELIRGAYTEGARGGAQLSESIEGVSRMRWRVGSSR